MQKERTHIGILSIPTSKITYAHTYIQDKCVYIAEIDVIYTEAICWAFAVMPTSRD